MAIEDILGAVSPVFSVVSGKGPYADLARSGVAGIIPQAIVPEKKQKSQNEVKQVKKGGMIKSSASKRADGCCQRGKTRGKIV
jgi:hypothetical protein